MARKRSYNLDGPALPAPLEWKEKAKAEIKRRFGSQAKFARHIGGSQAGVSQALSPTQPTSKYVRAISEALGWPVPVSGLEDEVEREVMAGLQTIRERSPEVYDSLRELIQTTAAELAKRPKK